MDDVDIAEAAKIAHEGTYFRVSVLNNILFQIHFCRIVWATIMWTIYTKISKFNAQFQVFLHIVDSC